ncbi:MAG TPA: hypothetical protein VGQ09_00365 [Chitinophagaceae bacterium]|jgi:hypothetical protein|nr:hypothetical protein [Chitinophagaceae bacterium]
MKFSIAFFLIGNYIWRMDMVATLVRSIFQKESLHDCSVEELQTMARQYSYFTPVQLLLVEKLRAADENLFKEQLQKLSLHFNNPLWLDYLLNGYQQQAMVKPVTESEVGDRQEHIETPIEESFIKSEPEISEPVIEEINEPLTENVSEHSETTIINDQQENQETREEHFIKSEPEISAPAIEEINESLTENVSEHSETTIVNDQQENQEVSEEHFIKSESEIAEAVKEEVNESQEINSFDDIPAIEEKQENIELQNHEMLIHTETETEIPAQPGQEASEPEISVPSLPDLKEEPAETELTFEPYHTVDYFASQGIKFVPEEKPADRFGQQLKSFTEWLKIMKRLPQTETTKTSDLVSEEKVQELAAHSISEDEAVTETMAEVWLKQGNKEKAVETYNKLSLLNPAKSHYFAAKIEQLKNS